MKKTMGFILGAVLTVSSIGAVMSVSAAEMGPASKELFENEIGMAKAVEIALQDAGLGADQAEFSKKVNEYSDGRCIYDLHFMTRGNTKYEYEVDAFTGDILQREQDPWEADDDMDYQGLAAAGQGYFNTEDETNQKAFEEAYQAAIKDSGLAEADITTYKYGVNYEDGRVVLDTGFIIPGQIECDYDVELGTLNIVDRDQDPWDAEEEAEYKNLLTPPAPADAAAAPAAAAPAAAPAAGGAVDDAAALATALADAGFTEADVNIVKCAIDYDDDTGVEYYDVDFFGPDGMKYEYDIRVSDGVITDRSAEFDD